MTKYDVLRIPNYLEHILQALDRIFAYTTDVDGKVFSIDTFTQDAVLRNFEILGEASRNLERYHIEFITQYPEVPWSVMYGVRNKISHGYFDVNLEIIWKTIESDLPSLYAQISEIYKNLPQAYHE